MQNILIYSPTAATRKLYHQTLVKREYDTYRAKDIAELLLLLVTFEIDTVIVVDEGTKKHELNMILDILAKKFDYKQIYFISPEPRKLVGITRVASTREFFDRFL